VLIMPNKDPIAFTLSNPEPRCILTVVERDDGQLVIFPQSNTKRRTLGTPIQDSSDSPQHGQGIKHFKWSIHNTLESKHPINVFKRILIAEDGTEESIVQYTTAIKKNFGFAPLFSHRCTVLDDASYSFNSNDRVVINLGPAKPQFTVYFSLFIGPRDRIFKLPQSIKHQRFNIHRHVFDKYSAVIIWSYLPIYNHEAGMFIEHASEEKLGFTAGMDEETCIYYFKHQTSLMRGEQIQTILS
jgi:hypothetical protein